MKLPAYGWWTNAAAKISDICAFYFYDYWCKIPRVYFACFGCEVVHVRPTLNIAINKTYRVLFLNIEPGHSFGLQSNPASFGIFRRKLCPPPKLCKIVQDSACDLSNLYSITNIWNDSKKLGGPEGRDYPDLRPWSLIRCVHEATKYTKHKSRVPISGI